MPNESALARVQRAASYGQIRTTTHGRERMSERGVLAEDVKKAIRSATRAIEQPAEPPRDGRPGRGPRVRLEGGTDTDGDPLTVVVAEEREGLRVVTVLQGKEEE
jgi:hypothetical protein